MKSVRGRILASAAAVVVAAVGAVGFLASRASQYEFRRIEMFRVVGGGDSPGIPPGVERRILEGGPGPANLGPARSVDRWIVAAVVGVGISSLAAMALLTGRILGPVEELTRAARRLESGDLAARVPHEGGDEIGELARAFNGMAEALSRNEEARRNMVSDAAHELRTPLTNIRAQIEAIQDGLAAADGRTVASLHEEAMLLTRLVEDLQDLALADAGELRMHFADVRIDDALARAAKAHEARAAARGVRLVTATAPDLPNVRADAERLGQILRNLLENAIAHTGEGGEISMSASSGEKSILVIVRDTGEGIPASELPRIFDRFYRADPSRSRGTGGSGLGLPIVRQLVAAHGGEIEIRSEPGRGTSAEFTLPPFTENS